MGVRRIFPGVGKLGVWEQKSPSGQRVYVQGCVRVWGKAPRISDDRL